MLKKWNIALLRCIEGSVVAEYAIVLPVMLFLIMSMVEIGIIMYVSAVVEGATNYAARVGQTGYYISSASGGTCAPTAAQVANNTSVQLQALYINCIAGTRVSGLLNPAQLYIVAKDYGSYATGDTPVMTSCSNLATATAVSTPPSCSSLQSFGNSGDVVVYTISYPWQVVTPFLKSILCTDCVNNPGVVTITSSAVVKNEPYSVSR